MNGRNAKALRKVFRAKENPENFKDFKRSLRNADTPTKKKALETARKIVKSSVPIYHGEIPNGGN